MSRYKYYQPNDKDLKDEYGDCTIRAISKIYDCDWLDAFSIQLEYCLEYQIANIFSAPLRVVKEIMIKMGFEYYSCPAQKGKPRMTVNNFAKMHKQGRYILNLANHIVAVVDGYYYDTWDSGYKCVYGYYKKVEE